MGRILGAWCLLWVLVLGLGGSARADQAYELGVIRVCVRPPGIAPGVGQWAYVSGSKTVVTDSRQVFQEKSHGKTIYVLDPAAPPENTKLLPIPHNELKCPRHVLPTKPPEPPPTATPPAAPAPKPAGGGAKKEAAKAPGAVNPSGAPKKEGQPPDPMPAPIAYGPPPPQEYHPGQPTGGSPPRTVLPIARPTKEGNQGMLPFTTVLPIVRRSGKPGSGRGSGSGDGGGGSDAPIEVAKKGFGDELASELAYAGAIANQQLNEDTHRPDGKQYGIPGGKNPNGPNHPAAQAAAGAVLVVAGVLSAGGFEKKLKDAIAKGMRLQLAEKTLGKEVIEELTNKYGAHLAEALAKNGTIGPYSVMRRFTEKLGGKYQAHHILEVQFARKFGLGNTDKIPSVILTEAQHKKVTAELARETANVTSREELWQAYQTVYKHYPAHWLESIQSYFGK